MDALISLIGRTTVGLLLAMAWAPHCLAADIDQDGLDDRVEAQLLARYRPFFLFASGEQYRPIAVDNYVRVSALSKGGDDDYAVIYSQLMLQTSPQLILDANVVGNSYCSSPSACRSDLSKNARATAYHLKPVRSVQGVAGTWPGRTGAPESVVRDVRNVGLYGHVVPIRLREPLSVPCDKRWSNVERPADGVLLYKVEYWQFFGFNAADNQPFDIGEHEGDWVSVQLLIKPAKFAPADVLCTPAAACGPKLVSPERVLRVSHFAHGQEMSFELSSGNSSSLPQPLKDGEMVELRGPAGSRSISINDRHFGNPCGTDMSVLRNNTLRMFRETVGQGAFNHPVVYIEKGGHEFWPTESGSFNYVIGGKAYYTERHEGDGMAFLTATPPNMGEVEGPMPDTRGSQLVLRFNGVWGKENTRNAPPPGPPLHGNWTWPASSSIGWLLGDGPY